MPVYDRQKKQYIKEVEYKEDMLKFLYHTKIGRVLLSAIVARPYFSKIVRMYKTSRFSKHEIQPFIEKYNISTKEYDLDTMKSFNDFFIRKRKVKSPGANSDELLAIADAKLSVYDITDNLKLNIKNSTYTVEEILNNKMLAGRFNGGKCLVYRLTIDDYHRYHYPDAGVVKKRYRIKGELHTIRPVASRYKAFSRNCREVTVMQTDNFGEVIQVEVGATLVGCIKNRNKGDRFRRLQEKGHFEYGGSTIILFMKDNIVFDGDIENCSKSNIEVKVRIGEKIGRLRCAESKYLGEQG